MKKFFTALLMLILSGRAATYESDFNGRPEELNSWAHGCSFDELCSALEKYRHDGRVTTGLLREFNRRNISYLNCKQYQR